MCIERGTGVWCILFSRRKNEGVLDDYYGTSIELLFCGKVCMEAVIAADYDTMQVHSGIVSLR